MNFDFSPEQYEFRDSLRAMLQKDFPLARATAAAADHAIEDGIWKSLAELGLFGLLAPGPHGGLDLTFVDAALLLEELGAALAPPAVFDTLLATDLLARHGSEEQKSRLLPRLAAGTLRVSIAGAEGHGFGPHAMQTLATAAGSHHVLRGTKILAAGADRADLLLVAATVGSGESGVVLLEPGRAGVSMRPHETLDLSARYIEIDFDQVHLDPTDWLDGKTGAGILERLFDGAATIASLHMVGIASRMLDTTVLFAHTREQFGKPIGSFQAIKHRCADMAVSLDAARTAAYYAAWALAESIDEQQRATSIGKSFCGDATRFICNESIQIHGGMGFTWELGLHYYLRRAKLLEYAWGDATYHRERVLAHALSALEQERGSDPTMASTGVAA